MRLALILITALLALCLAAVSPSVAAACGIPDSGDTDCDGFRTDGNGPADNCPDARNNDQYNQDSGYTATSPAAADGSATAMPGGDAAGDACDSDDDADGVDDTQDNCRLVRNPDQLDSDGDGRGDAPDGADLCPPIDGDGDGTIDEDDNCPTIVNADQADNDRDRRGDVCEYDDDGDGVVDQRDNCPLVPNSEQADRDADGVGTACDPQEIPPSADPAFTATAADSVAPVVRLSSASRRDIADARGRLATSVSCTEACELRGTVRLRGAIVAVAESRLGAAGRTWLFFTWRRGALTRVRGRKVTLEVVATDAARNSRRARRAVRILR